MLHLVVDGSSNALADVGLSARIQGEECLSTALDGKLSALGC